MVLVGMSIRVVKVRMRVNGFEFSGFSGFTGFSGFYGYTVLSTEVGGWKKYK